MMITSSTATNIAFAYREIETAEKLLGKVEEALKRNAPVDVRDVFGRLQTGLQLGVPMGDTGQRLFDVPWALAKPIIEAHIATKRALISALSEKARLELEE